MIAAAAAIRQKVGAPAKPAERVRIERTLAQVRQRLSARAYARAWKDGLSGVSLRIDEVPDR
jgi:hypothetical protein